MSPITYDEMRPGCYDPKARIEDMDDELGRGVAVLPDVPALLRPDVPRGQGPRARRCACVQAYNDWMVEEWCGDSDGRLIPLIIIPLWDAELAAAEVRRNAGARRARGVLQRDPAAPRAAVDPHRRLGPVLRGVRGDRAPSCACTSARRRRCRPTSADAPAAVAADADASTTRWRR